MPPRRSSRSRASVEPQPPTAPTKRKRISPNENIAPSVSAEDVKPLVKPSKGTRGSARSAKSLEDVRESDEDEDDERDSPPVKKSRPSLENEASGDETGDDKPVRPRRAASRQPSAPIRGRKGKAIVKNEIEDEELSSDEEEEEEVVKPTRRGARKVVDVSDDEFEDEKPAKPKRGSSSTRGTSSRGRRGRGSAAPKASSSRARRATSVLSEPDAEPASIQSHQPEDDDSDSLSYVDMDRTPRKPVKKTPITAIQEEELEEEEHSLLEPTVAPKAPTPLPQTEPTVVLEPQGPQARLVIHKMMLINFKSYAGKQEIGPFHKSFSSIVGPNGSGKSNTIDALLFVFGYRASKMRQGKLSELIHNSARHPDLNECSVEVHFREIIDLPGPDAFEVVPDSSLVVTRTAFKNNSSKYSINGRASNYKEVQTLLKGRGIDLDHNRFLILQGEVESIAQMKPKAPTEHEDGLLEYLEDIIGTAQYKEAIDDAFQMTERLNEDRMEKIGRLKIVEASKASLEKEKKEVEDYLRLQNEHVRALSRLWQYYIWRCLENETQLEQTILHLEQELAAETERNQDDITHLAMLEKHFKERQDAYDEVSKAAADAEKELVTNEQAQVNLEERIKHANSKVKKLEKTLKEDERSRNEAARAIKDNAAKMEKEKNRLDDLEESLSREEKVLEDIRDSLKDKTQVYHEQIEVKQRELQPWTAKINAKQSELDVATGERDMLVQKAEAAQKAVEDAQTTLEQLQEDHGAKTKEVEELKSQKVQNARDLENGNRRLQALRAKVQDLKVKASSSRQKLEEGKVSQAANTSQNRVLDTLTRLRSSGRITGFHGRLGSLGTIPERYDVAVSTACGALNNMVVDTVDQGQACIEYLRKQNVGRASFMVLEKLSKDGMDKIATPENVPRLFDLIKPKDPRFAPAFFKGVGNTLVADNLDQANRIAFGGQRRWRVVTLAGQLIDSSGTMSGGGNHVARGGMSAKLVSDAVSPEALREFERDSEAAHNALAEAQTSLQDLEAELETLAKVGPQIDMAVQKANLEIHTGTKRIDDAEKRLRELKAKTKPDSGDIARIRILDKEIAVASKELGRLQEQTADIEKQIKSLEDQILEIGGARLLSQKSKVDGLRLNINLASDELTRAEVAKAKAEKDVGKLDGSIATNKSTLDDLSADLDALSTEMKQLTTYADELREEVSKAQAAVDNASEDLNNLKAELDEKTAKIQGFRKKEMDLKQRLADAKKEASDNERSLNHWKDEHDKLRLEEIDDEEDEEDDPNLATDNPQGTNDHADKPPRDRTPLDELPLYSEAELATFNKRELIADAELLDEKLKNSKPNMSVLKDYRKREQEYLKRAADLQEVTEQHLAQKAKHSDLCKRRLDEFMVGFNTISLKLKEMYQMITLGGNAELELVDSMDPFAEGIIFSVMPPKKSWKNISNLSGGEKTLSSLALVFALHVYKPTPLYFMDEIDAALDFRNVSIVANYIKDRTKNAQFIIISLRNDMFELSHRLIGIYKTSNATRSISIDNHPLHTPQPHAPLSRAPLSQT